MASFTSEAIRQAFLSLLEEKPLKRISVRDIVDRCGVNRNTFYYHYQDIPQLLVSIIRDDADAIIRRYPTISTLEECINTAVEFLFTHRKSVLHVYRSVNRDIYESYQWRVCLYAASTYMDGVLKGHTVSDEDRQLMVGYLSCVAFGVVNSWLEQGMHSDIRAQIHRLCEMKQGDLESMIARCEKK